MRRLSRKKTTPRLQVKELPKEIMIKQLETLSYVSEEIKNCRCYLMQRSELSDISNSMIEIFKIVSQLEQ